jgi:Ca2+-binding RTX toxin-like protein
MLRAQFHLLHSLEQARFLMSGTQLSTNINTLVTQLINATQPNDASTPSPLAFLTYLGGLQSETLLKQLLGEADGTAQINRLNSLAAQFGFNSDLIPDIPLSTLLLANPVFRFQKATGSPVTSTGTASTGTDLITSLIGPAQAKNITGLSGNDLIGSVGRGSVVIEAGAGDDMVANISLGNNTLRGGSGNDFLLNVGGYTPGTQKANHQLIGGDGNDTLVNIAAGNSTLSGGAGDDFILNYGIGKNTLTGGNGNDILINLINESSQNGDAGNDILVGAGKADTLTGGIGNDTLVGGGGADQFVMSYRLAAGSTTTYISSGIDTLLDFSATAGDKIRIDVDTNQIATLGASLSFDATTSSLSINGQMIAILSGVASFDTATSVVLF